MNHLELKRNRIENIVKLLGIGIIAFIVSPFIYVAIQGLVGLLVTAAIALITINLLPSFAKLVANWRLKALKAVAAANPIETLENQYAEREVALVNIRTNIKEFHSVIQELYAQIQEHNSRYPEKPSQFEEKYNKMKSLLALRSQKYKQAQNNLNAFAELIELKRSDWKIAQAAARASKLANAGEDFQSNLMKDTALSTIQDGLNLAFSELEVSLLDEQPSTDKVIFSTAQPVVQIPEKTGPPTLDLEFDDSSSDSGMPVYRHVTRV